MTTSGSARNWPPTLASASHQPAAELNSPRSKQGAKDLTSRKEVAATLLTDAQNERSKGDHDQGQVLDRLLEAEPLDEKFMLED